MGNCLQTEADLDVPGGWKVDAPKASAVAPASPEKPVYLVYEAPKEIKSLRVFGDPMCPLTMQILLALRHKGVPYECSWLKDDFNDLKRDWSGRNGSASALPVLQHGIDKITGQPDSMIQYIDRSFPEPSLVPKGELGNRVQEWAIFLRDTLFPLVSQLLYDGERSIQQELEPELDLAFSKVNGALSTFSVNGPYFFGSIFTLADVVLIPILALIDPLKHFRRLDIGSTYLSLLTYQRSMSSFPEYTASRVTPESLRLYVAKKLEQRVPPPLLILILMQHRSILWHFERLVILVDELVGSLESNSPTKRGARAAESNLRKLWKGYGRLVELMQEHAQMEERVIFPTLEEDHEGVTEAANADHGRDLPVTNGIREDLKGLLALNQGSSDYKEAVLALAARLRTLQLHTQEHFKEEEKDFLPLLDSPVFGGNKTEVEPFVTHCLGVMESSHKHLLPFLLAGLNPQDIYSYMMVLHKNLWEKRPSLFTQMLHVINHSDEEFIAVKKIAQLINSYRHHPSLYLYARQSYMPNFVCRRKSKSAYGIMCSKKPRCLITRFIMLFKKLYAKLDAKDGLKDLTFRTTIFVDIIIGAAYVVHMWSQRTAPCVESGPDEALREPDQSPGFICEIANQPRAYCLDEQLLCC